MAELQGHITFDTALPQTWADLVFEATGNWPFGFVWSYDSTETDKSQIWGHPVPITDEAKALFERLPTRFR